MLKLDLRMRAWNERPLGDMSYPFLIIDALVIKVRRDGAVRLSQRAYRHRRE